MTIRWTLLAAYSAFLLAGTSYIARTGIWFDEIVTFYVGTLPSLKAVWHNLLLGTEDSRSDSMRLSIFRTAYSALPRSPYVPVQ